jgi:hypothetical protein
LLNVSKTQPNLMPGSLHPTRSTQWFGRALRAAIESGLADRRVALGRVGAAALEDEAIVDRSGLLVDTLAQVEAPHIKALVSVREAVQEVKDRGEWPSRAAGAEHEIFSRVTRVGNQFDDSVIRTLKNLRVDLCQRGNRGVVRS